MKANYLILIIILATILFKAVANATNYWYNKETVRFKKVYGVLYHIFQVFMIITPTLVLPVLKYISWWDYIFTMLAAGLIYFGIFNNLYNRMIGKNPAYLGKVDIIDRFLRWAFKIEKDPNNQAKNKNLVLWLRFLLGMVGVYIIIDILVF